MSCGVSHRKVERRTGVDRKTLRRYATASRSTGVATGSDAVPEQNPPPRPPAQAEAAPSPPIGASACEPHRTWLEVQLQQELVVTGLYRFSRNPMPVAVLLVLWGWALGFRSWPLAVYAVVVMLAFHLRVVLHEEPWLARTHGEKWMHYATHVPRRFGVRHRFGRCNG